MGMGGGVGGYPAAGMPGMVDGGGGGMSGMYHQQPPMAFMPPTGMTGMTGMAPMYMSQAPYVPGQVRDGGVLLHSRVYCA